MTGRAPDDLCIHCGRACPTQLDMMMHHMEAGHRFAPTRPCPHGIRRDVCEPCAEQDFEARIGWDDSECTYGC